MNVIRIFKAIAIAGLLWACKNQPSINLTQIEKAELYNKAIKRGNGRPQLGDLNFSPKNVLLLEPSLIKDIQDIIAQSDERIYSSEAGTGHGAGFFKNSLIVRLSDKGGQQKTYVINKKYIINPDEGLAYHPKKEYQQNLLDLCRKIAVFKSQAHP